jgi:hypothetical protein
MVVPSDPRIYHITHVDNLPGIHRDGCLWSDAQRIRRRLQVANIAYLHIKQRRLRRPVPVAAKGMLGEYVPFNFCPRSVMLYAVHRGHGDYSNGQSDIVHLVSTVRRAISTGRPWAFTDRHADLLYADYYDDLSDLGEVAWDVMPLIWWNDDELKSRRQAEFLVHDWFRWDAVLEIGVIDDTMAARVRSLLPQSVQNPAVVVRQDWYY